MSVIVLHTCSKSTDLSEKGSILYTNHGRPIATIHDDNCGRHDTLGGACSCESNTVRYAHDKYPMHSCRNNFMYALSSIRLPKNTR
jgi:uncharacterized protein YcgI (DUF1989 family)